MADIDEYLVEIEREVQNSRKTVIGSGVIVNPDAIFSLVDQIRNSLPDVIRQARHIVANAKKMQQEESLRLQNMIMQAETKANEILSNHEIIRKAEQEAEVIRNQALEYKQKILDDVARDLDKLLSNTEMSLENSLQIVKCAHQNNQTFLGD